MKRLVQTGLLSALLLVVVSCQGLGLAFDDPSFMFSTVIPERWVYQAQRSTSNLNVFYGEGDYDLLYFQDLGPILDATVEIFAERTLALYGGPGGLANFHLEQPPQEVQIAGERGLACAYTYEERSGTKLWEYRIFLILPEQRGFSMALGGGGAWVDQEYPVLTEILSQWRWLF